LAKKDRTGEGKNPNGGWVKKHKALKKSEEGRGETCDRKTKEVLLPQKKRKKETTKTSFKASPRPESRREKRQGSDGLKKRTQAIRGERVEAGESSCQAEGGKKEDRRNQKENHKKTIPRNRLGRVKRRKVRLKKWISMKERTKS